MKLDEKVIRPLSPRESRLLFCYCCIGVLLPFDTFEVILGAVNYYNHNVTEQSLRLVYIMTVEIVSWPISAKEKSIWS